ncbi:4'-phosphopantetheinyl transferase [Paenibacillus silvae]|uniref:4'-phosphopantetheinyl transferase n=1 Tax=Paenibacillus silvae TaxID=1325358 RepID=A0ABQ1ZFF6_9BACL|nr:4'-phosphopantetheinyl transferase superfamily protein [Paenibacillus silvae]GGH58118.1 4'-phosphopantetheinyl transferase [Paenibacillus silvae]
MVKLLALKVPSVISQNNYSLLLSSLTNEERLLINTFNSTQDAYRSLLAKVMVRCELSNRFDLAVNEIRISSNKYGKPLLEGLTFFFNVSHSEEWVVAAFDDEPIGIDIEKIQPIDYLKIANRFFSREEYTDLIATTPDQQLQYFYDLWTLKESYVKQIGLGLKMPLNTFSIRKANTCCFEFAGKMPNYFSGPCFHQYNVIPQYCISVCASKQAFPKTIDFIGIEMLTNVLNRHY